MSSSLVGIPRHHAGSAALAGAQKSKPKRAVKSFGCDQVGHFKRDCETETEKEKPVEPECKSHERSSCDRRH